MFIAEILFSVNKLLRFIFLVFLVVLCKLLGENYVKKGKIALIAIKSALRTEFWFELVW